MMKDKKWKIIASVTICCVVTLVLFTSPQNDSTVKLPDEATYDRYSPIFPTDKPRNTTEHKYNVQGGVDTLVVKKLENEDSVSVKLPTIPDYVINMAPDLFKKIPRQFSPEYKSPCWFDKGHELNCLPYFYIIGTAKCGTTELWDKITQHPDVIERVPKELHWWSRRRLDKKYKKGSLRLDNGKQVLSMIKEKDQTSADWYLGLLRILVAKPVQSHPTENSPGDVIYSKVSGDASVSTSFDVYGTWKEKERNYSTADLIHAAQPKAKIILIVRDPAARFFSAFHFNLGRYRNSKPDTFDKISRTGTSCFKKCIERHSERFCVFTKQCEIHKGIYITIAEEWMRVYGHDGVHILRLEDWYQNPTEELKRVLRFLDLRSLPDEEVQKITSSKPKNVNSRKAKLSPMWNSTRTHLQNFFRPYNQRFADLMNDPRYLFGY